MSILRIKIIRSTKDVENISEYYNQEFLKEPRYDIYGFFNETDTEINGCRDRVLDIFKKDMKLTGVIYFDKYLKKVNNTIHSNSETLIAQLYPPFESEKKIIFNPTIFVNGHINQPIFDPTLNNLRTHDVIQRLSKVSKIIHIPQILMISDYNPTNIKEELESYVRKSST